MSVLASQKDLILLGFGGGPLETRTPDPLIKRLARFDGLSLNLLVFLGLGGVWSAFY